MNCKSLLFCACFTSLLSSTPAATVIKILHINPQAKVRAIWQESAQGFESTHPGVKAEFDYLENEAFKAKLPTLLQSKDRPSMFHSWGGGGDGRTDRFRHLSTADRAIGMAGESHGPSHWGPTPGESSMTSLPISPLATVRPRRVPKRLRSPGSKTSSDLRTRPETSTRKRKPIPTLRSTDAFSGLVADEIRNSAQGRTFLELARLRAQNNLQ
jgi:hypothetical protein